MQVERVKVKHQFLGKGRGDFDNMFGMFKNALFGVTEETEYKLLSSETKVKSSATKALFVTLDLCVDIAMCKNTSTCEIEMKENTFLLFFLGCLIKLKLQFKSPLIYLY